jgi:hypothetical protein
VLATQNAESVDYALDFVEVFRSAGWKIFQTGIPGPVDKIGYDVEPLGPQIAVPANENADSQTRLAANKLLEILLKMGLTTTQSIDEPVHDRLPGLLEFSAGRKPKKN